MNIYILFTYSFTYFLYFLPFFKECHLSTVHAKSRDGNPARVHFGDHGVKLKNLLSKNGTHDIGFHLTEEEILKYKIWPRGNIFYFIDEFSFDKVLRDRIRKYLDELNGATMLQFIELPQPPQDNSTRWVLFVNRRGQLDCVDYTSKTFTASGVQRVVLGYDCLSAGSGALMATVLALAGVPPQHNAPDRDKYIEILTENIIPDKKYFFEVLSEQDWLFSKIPYDFNSAGHYDLHKYTKNGAATIKVKDNVDSTTGQAEGISNLDILKIDMLYSYITKHSEASYSKCSKLFRPAANFDNFKPNEKKNKPGHKLKNHFAEKKDETEKSGVPNVEKKNNAMNNNVNEDTKSGALDETIKQVERIKLPASGVKKLKHRVIGKKTYLFNLKSDYNTKEIK